MNRLKDIEFVANEEKRKILCANKKKELQVKLKFFTVEDPENEDLTMLKL